MLKTKDMLEAVKKVLPATTNKGLVEGWDTLIFCQEELIAYNDRICISILLPKDSCTDVEECGVNAKDFLSIVSGINEDEIMLYTEDGKLHIDSQNTEASLSTHTSKGVLSLVDSVDLDTDNMTELPDDFIEALNLCKFAVSNDFTDEKQLYCLLLDSCYVYSSDSYRISKFKLSKDVKQTCLIPKSVLDDLINFKPKEIQVTPRWVHFMNEEQACFSCRIFEKDKFPDMEKILHKFKKGKVTFEMPAGLKNVLDSLGGIFDTSLASSKHVFINIKNGKLTLEVERETLRLKKTLAVSDEDIEVSFGVSSVFLSEILNLTNEISLGEIYVRFDTDNFTHLVMFAV
jgi:DNA polymerase III sliding clamp (beta) subunit (PCNA family)